MEAEEKAVDALAETPEPRPPASAKRGAAEMSETGPLSSARTKYLKVAESMAEEVEGEAEKKGEEAVVEQTTEAEAVHVQEKAEVEQQAVAKQAGEKRKVGAPEEKAAKRQRTEEAEKEALRLYFKRQELKERGCGVPAWKCRRSVLDPSCVVLCALLLL